MATSTVSNEISDKQLKEEKEKQRLMNIYEHGNRKARREVLSKAKRNWRRSQRRLLNKG